MFSLIPWNKVAGLLLVISVALTFVAGYQRNTIKALKAENAVAVAKAEKAAAELKTAQGIVTVKTVTEYVDRVQIVREKGATIVKEVPIYVPNTDPDLSGGWRILHDSAAQGVLPDPARIADAESVPAPDAAATVASNYTICHETEAQLEALQSWVREQAAIK